MAAARFSERVADDLRTYREEVEVGLDDNVIELPATQIDDGRLHRYVRRRVLADLSQPQPLDEQAAQELSRQDPDYEWVMEQPEAARHFMMDVVLNELVEEGLLFTNEDGSYQANRVVGMATDTRIEHRRRYVQYVHCQVMSRGLDLKSKTHRAEAILDHRMRLNAIQDGLADWYEHVLGEWHADVQADHDRVAQTLDEAVKLRMRSIDAEAASDNPPLAPGMRNVQVPTDRVNEVLDMLGDDE